MVGEKNTQKNAGINEKGKAKKLHAGKIIDQNKYK